MLLPRFSTRVILLVMAICAVYFLMVGLGLRGSIWAAGVAIAATSLVLMGLVHATLFGLCYVVASRMKRQPIPNLPRLLCLVLVLACFVSPVTLFASTGGVITLPPAKIMPQSGLRVTVDSTWVENFGYIPIEVTITSAKPTTADQTITFRFKAGRWRFGETPVMAVDRDIEMPEGSTSVSATVLVPKLQQWDVAWWDVLVDGRFERELSLDRNSMGWFNQGGGVSGDGLPRILVVADEGQQVGMSSSVLGSPAFQQQGVPGITLQQPGGNFTYAGVTTNIAGAHFAAQRTAAELPESWLAYTALDHLVCSPEQLADIQGESPKAWTAIARWVRTGGNLWLVDVGAGWQGLDDVLARLEPLVEPDETGEVRWYMPFSAQNTGVSSAFTREAAARERASELAPRATFAWRPAGLGSLLISQEPFEKLDMQQWTWLHEQDGRNLGWTRRHGTAPDAPNLAFGNLLIPGVGVAPVTEFRILITLFVVLIGPVNYWFLRRYKRLHLLILSVPLGALAITLALFAYAVVGDGLATRLRTRSYTAIDQRSGEAVSWARMSYYAGLAPSGGLEFPTDVAVYPVNPGSTEMSSFGNDFQPSPRALQWADEQYLTQGWLASRTPTQYLAIAARPTTKGLQIAREGDSKLRVTNRLGASVSYLVLRDSDGQLYQGASVEPEAAVELSPVQDEAKISGKLRELFRQHAPEFPEGYDTLNQGLGARRYRNRYRSFGYSDEPEANVASGRFEQRLNSFTQPVGSNSGRSVNLESGTYLALTSQGVEVVTGLEDPVVEASFHVVEGRW